MIKKYDDDDHDDDADDHVQGMDAGQHRSSAILIQAKIAPTGRETHLRLIDLRQI